MGFQGCDGSVVDSAGAKSDMAIRTHQGHANAINPTFGWYEPPGRAINDLYQLAPSRSEMVKPSWIAKMNEMVGGSLQATAAWKAVTRRRTPAVCPTNDRAAGIRNIEHCPPARDRHGCVGIGFRQQGCSAIGAHRHETHDEVMDLVRNIHGVVVGKAALKDIAFEERWFGVTAHNQGKFPGDVGGIHECLVDPFSAEWAR